MKRNDCIEWLQPFYTRYCGSVSASASPRSLSASTKHTKSCFLSKEKSWEDRSRAGNGRRRRWRRLRRRQTIYDLKTLLLTAYTEASSARAHTQLDAYIRSPWSTVDRLFCFVTTTARQTAWCNRMKRVCVLCIFVLRFTFRGTGAHSFALEQR